MTRLAVFLEDTHFNALCKLAEHEYRDPRSQAALIISNELERKGYLLKTHDDKQQNENEDEY